MVIGAVAKFEFILHEMTAKSLLQESIFLLIKLSRIPSDERECGESERIGSRATRRRHLRVRLA